MTTRRALIITAAIALTGALAPSDAHALDPQAVADDARVPTVPLTLGDPATAPCADWMAACSDGTTLWIVNERRVGDVAIWHELGHLFDRQLLTRTDHLNLAPTLGREGVAWDTPVTGESDPSTAERFAEAYSLCAMSRQVRLEDYGWWRPQDWPFGRPSAYESPAYAGIFRFGRLARVCGYVRLVARRPLYHRLPR